ncbi:MAG: PilZ domain-containing protein [bacterium]|nr:PilZ domain-containing protein [bacterium]
MQDNTYLEKRQSPRIESSGPVEFALDTSTVDGIMLDVSSSGLRMTTPTPLEVTLQIGPDGPRRGTLVWACQKDDGSCMYGFKYE